PVGREGSLFQRVFSSASGIDPYASAVSDVYQDLFGEGSYAGKGIYHVDAFEAALAGRVSDGMLLSHDLFEGVFARAALVSDIEVVEEFPARYDVAAARQHRWARGDWQLLPWVFGRGDAAGAIRGRRSLSLLALWKMLDNLRRTLSAQIEQPVAARSVEDAGQSAAYVVGTREYRGPAGRMDVATQRRARLDHLCRIDACRTGAAANFRRHRTGSRRPQDTQPPARAAPRHQAGCFPERLPDSFSCASGLAHARRDRSNAVSSVRQSTESAAVGHFGSDESRTPA